MATAWTKWKARDLDADGGTRRLQEEGGIADHATVSRTPNARDALPLPALVVATQPTQRSGESI